MGLLARVWRGLLVLLGVGAITLVLLVVVLEGAYVGYQWANRSFWGKRAVFARADHPFWNQPWFAGWEHRVGVLARGSGYDPYRGYRLPSISSPGLHIDTAGVRLTIHPMVVDSAPTRQVFMLGGSTMWGYAARDEFTIPSLVAERLAKRGLTDVRVVNLAAIGYNVTQGATTLLLQLRRGNIPTAVVSLDGVNEVGVVAEGGRPGEIYQQARAEEQFDHDSFWFELARLRHHFRGLTVAEAVVSRRLGLEYQAPPDRKTICTRITDYYVQVTRAVEAIGRDYAFPTLFLTTPTLARSGKRRTPWEASVDSNLRVLRDLTTRCAGRADTLMATRRGKTFFPLDSLFDADTTSVFIDNYGHVTERANGVIADRITELLVPILQPAGPP